MFPAPPLNRPLSQGPLVPCGGGIHLETKIWGLDVLTAISGGGVGGGRCSQASHYTPLLHPSQACCAVQVSSSLGYSVPGHTPYPVVSNTLVLGHPCPWVTDSLPLLGLQHLCRATSSHGHPLTHSRPLFTSCFPRPPLLGPASPDCSGRGGKKRRRKRM